MGLLSPITEVLPKIACGGFPAKIEETSPIVGLLSPITEVLPKIARGGFPAKIEETSPIVGLLSPITEVLPKIACGGFPAKIEETSPIVGLFSPITEVLPKIACGGFPAKKKAGSYEPALCGKRDLNPYGVNHTPLKRARLPVPPLPHIDRRSSVNDRYYSTGTSVCQGIF